MAHRKVALRPIYTLAMGKMFAERERRPRAEEAVVDEDRALDEASRLLDQHVRAAQSGAVRRMSVGAADDPTERRADELAERAMRSLPTLVRSTGSGRIRRSATEPMVGAAGGDLDADTAGRIERARPSGRPLDDGVRTSMENAFGSNFSAVRVHSNADSGDLSDRLQARAFTSGNDVFFGRGEFRTETATGRRLLAHELAHVVQQGAGRVERSWVRRDITVTLTDFDTYFKHRTGLSGLRHSDSDGVEKIRAELKKYHSYKPNHPKALGRLRKLMELCNRYVDARSGKRITDGGEQARLELIARLGQEVGLEWGRRAAQERYVQDAYGTGTGEKQSGGKDTRLQHQTQATSTHTGSRAHAAGTPISVAGQEVEGAGNAAIMLAVTKGLTEAEILAIRTYTAGDYTYMNRAVGGAADTITGATGATVSAATQKSMASEGVLHAGVLTQAMAKLDLKSGLTYRGERRTPAWVSANLTPGSPILHSGFVSASTDRNKAENMFAGGMSAQPKPGETASVLYIIHTAQARDVGPFSVAGKEKEWLHPAGSRFTINKVVQLSSGAAGNPAVPATAWYEVHIDQVPPGAPSPAPSPSPLTSATAAAAMPLASPPSSSGSLSIPAGGLPALPSLPGGSG